MVMFTYQKNYFLKNWSYHKKKSNYKRNSQQCIFYVNT